MTTTTAEVQPPVSIRRRVWEIVETARPGDMASRYFDVFLLVLVILNVLAVVLQSVREVELAFGRQFVIFELFSVAVFSLEYLLRVWACVEDQRFTGAIRGRLRFAVTPMSIIDLLAILPTILAAGSLDLRVLRALRLVRLLRVAKAMRYVAALMLFRTVVRSKREELVLTTGLMLTLLLLASSLIYFAENTAQPDKFSSIPASMWWAVATLTTVGYGDVYPVTAAGKVAGACVAILGIGFFALPTAIIGAGFVDALKDLKAPRVCPHCARPIDSNAS